MLAARRNTTLSDNESSAEHGQATQREMGRVFDDTPLGKLRKYWFVGGFGAGVLGVGTIQHWGIPTLDVALIFGSGILLIALITIKKRGEWDV